MRAELLAALDGLSDERMTEATLDGWSVKDNLAHRAFWTTCVLTRRRNAAGSLDPARYGEAGLLSPRGRARPARPRVAQADGVLNSSRFSPGVAAGAKPRK